MNINSVSSASAYQQQQSMALVIEEMQAKKASEKIEVETKDVEIEKVKALEKATQAEAIANSVGRIESSSIGKIAEDTASQNKPTQSESMTHIAGEMVETQANSAKYAGNGNNITAKQSIGNISQGQAKYNVSEEGGYGTNAVADRITDLAITVAGDDPEKMAEMREAVKKGFESAGMEIGKDGTASGLPQVSLDAYNEIQSRFEYAIENKNSLEGYNDVVEERIKDQKVENKIQENAKENRIIEEKRAVEAQEITEAAVEVQEYSSIEEATHDTSAATTASEVVASNIS